MKYLYEQYLGFDKTSFEHQTLFFLGTSVVVLFLLALCFALFALLLRRGHNQRELLWKRLHELWDKDILNVLSGDMSPAEFLKLVRHEDELDFVRYLMPYGWRLRGSDLVTLKSLALHYLPHVAPRLQARDAGVRIWAMNVISVFGMPEYEQAAFAALQDKSPAVAMAAATALLAQKHVSYIPRVMDHFHRFDKWNLHKLASLLSGMGPDAIPLLENIYLDPARPVRTRIIAAQALINYADYPVADSAADQLGTDQDPELIVATLRLLREVGQQYHSVAVRAICNAPLEFLRVNALRTLRALCTSEDYAIFLRALDDPSPWVARQAVYGMKDLGGHAALEQLVRDGHPRAALVRQILAE
ncbi:MAG: hypothetical protein RLZZ227_2473 [Pseudomonadota bacterium]